MNQSACITDRKYEWAFFSHRAWHCTHNTAVTLLVPTQVQVGSQAVSLILLGEEKFEDCLWWFTCQETQESSNSTYPGSILMFRYTCLKRFHKWGKNLIASQNQQELSLPSFQCKILCYQRRWEKWLCNGWTSDLKLFRRKKPRQALRNSRIKPPDLQLQCRVWSVIRSSSICTRSLRE